MKHKLPHMRCDNGCGQCCGIVPVTQAEFERIQQYAKEHDIEPINQGIDCPWYKNRCMVYPVRPLMCKLFGHSAKMTCPKGYNVNVPDRYIRRLMEHNGVCTTTLHHIITSGGFIQAIQDVKQHCLTGIDSQVEMSDEEYEKRFKDYPVSYKPQVIVIEKEKCGQKS